MQACLNHRSPSMRTISPRTWEGDAFMPSQNRYFPFKILGTSARPFRKKKLSPLEEITERRTNALGVSPFCQLIQPRIFGNSFYQPSVAYLITKTCHIYSNDFLGVIFFSIWKGSFLSVEDHVVNWLILRCNLPNGTSLL